MISIREEVPMAMPPEVLWPQLGHDRTEERGRRFRAAQTDWRGGVVAVGRRAPDVLARRAQSALGDPRLGLVVLHVRRWGPVDYRRGDSPVTPSHTGAH